MTRDSASQYSEQMQQTSFDEARRTVACVICNAVYTPSQAYEYLSLTSAIALESALMSMSHFCFRCRRPACPQCWDEIHGVCGACVQEAHLPFRRASAPLKGALFVAAPQTQGQSEHKRSPLVCVRHGKFQRPVTSARKSAMAPVRMRRPAASPGGHVVRKVPRATPGRPTRELPPFPQDDIAEKDTQPVRHEELAEKDTQPTRHEELAEKDTQPTRHEELAQGETQSARPEDIIELDTQPIVQRSIWRRVEQTLTVCVSLLLLLLLVTILLALVFPAVNSLIASTLHIDIQAEIGYLLQLITHLH